MNFKILYTDLHKLNVRNINFSEIVAAVTCRLLTIVKTGITIVIPKQGSWVSLKFTNEKLIRM